jgi:uncharacterized membrane protein
MSKARIEAFSDGVFAIAATLLIVELHVGEGPLDEALLDAWPGYAAYAISFLSIGIMWIQHQTILHMISAVDRRFLIVNLVLLMVIAFFPFPTALVAEHLEGDEARPAALAYGITFTMAAFAFNACWHYARLFLSPEGHEREAQGITRSYALGPVVSLAATLIALVSPQACVAIFGAMILMYMLDSSLFSRRSPERQELHRSRDEIQTPEGLLRLLPWSRSDRVQNPHLSLRVHRWSRAVAISARLEAVTPRSPSSH